MPQHRNNHVILKERATGLPAPELFELVEGDAPTPGDGEILINNIYVTADPGMKGWISIARNYASVETGTTMHSFSVGVVVESNNPDIKEGDVVTANTGWAEYAVADPSLPTFRKVDPNAAPLSAALGILGINGFTAYFGLLEVGQPKAGDTVLVSTAAGAVGSAVGQIAKIAGCHVVGIAGSEEKCDFITGELGFDIAINHRTTSDMSAALRDACPRGIDCYFDNVGGPISDAAFENMALGARVGICGQIAQYNDTEQAMGPRNLRHFLVKRATMRGLLVVDWRDRYEIGRARLTRWVQEGRIKYREDVVEGLENAPSAFAGLMEGKNFGKQLVRIGQDTSR